MGNEPSVIVGEDGGRRILCKSCKGSGMESCRTKCYTCSGIGTIFYRCKLCSGSCRVDSYCGWDKYGGDVCGPSCTCTKQCPECDGSGKGDVKSGCEKCEGSGACPKCDGIGRKSCSTCSGQKMIPVFRNSSTYSGPKIKKISR